jgi:hypothetical protein
MEDWPLLSRTPMILYGWLLMRMFLPTGLASSKRLDATVGPMTATRLRELRSLCVMKEPDWTTRERMCRYSGVTP